MERVISMPMLDDEEYKAMMDLIKNSYLDTDPQAWKDLTLGMYDEYKNQGKDVPLELLAALGGEPWIPLYIPATAPYDDRPWGGDAQVAIGNIIMSHFMPFYYLLDENNGDVFITIVLSKQDLEQKGIKFEKTGVGNSEIGNPGPNGVLSVPVSTFPLSDKERERYWGEYITREIGAYGADAIGMTEREAKKWIKEHPYDKKKKASKSLKDFFNR